MAPNFTKEYITGQREIIKNTQLLLLTEDEDLFSKLDYANEAIFLNPFVFSYFHQQHWALGGAKGNFALPRVTLPQVLFASTRKDKMAGEYSFSAWSDESGVVHLPYVGYLRSDVRADLVEVWYDKNKNSFELYKDNGKIAHSFIPPCFVENSTIELFSFSNPYFNNVFESAFDGFNRGREEKERYDLTNTPVTALAAINKKKIDTAYFILRKSGLNYFPLFDNSIRGIFNFSNAVIWSFAHKGAYGVSFLSGDENDSLIFFAAELAHQGGHTVFTAILNKIEKYIAIDPTTKMNEVTTNSSDLRSVENAIHGLYTTSKVAEILDYLYQNRDRLDLDREHRHELVGRLADNYYRHKTGLHSADVEKIFTKRGMKIYTSLDNYLTRVYSKYSNLTRNFRYEKGDFVFNYRKFKERFPLN